MTCPRCGGKTRVIDTVNSLEESEIYRKRKCCDCELAFYTTEYVVKNDMEFRKTWYGNHRSYI